MVEIIDLGKGAPFTPGRNKDSDNHSEGTERVLREKYDRLAKENPGEKFAIAGMFRKY